MVRTIRAWVSASIFLMILTVLGSVYAGGVSYSDPNNWAYLGTTGASPQSVDVFFVCPTVYAGSDTELNMPITDAANRKKFLGAINMEKGIYDARSNFYAPYYRQVGVHVFQLSPTAAAPYFDIAYQDVKDAFEYYLQEYNHGRPIILAGFSQGSLMVKRLMQDLYQDQRLQQQLVAAYLIGWRVTQEETAQYPQLRMAQSERDTGVIVSFNTEAPNVETSALVPDKTLGINPLNWKATSEPALRSLNKGAVFTGYDGKIKKEIPYLTGAYLDPVRGTLKVTDISADDYPPMLDIFEKGVYHVYDYQFFYRNLQENVGVRIDAFWKKQALPAAS